MEYKKRTRKRKMKMKMKMRTRTRTRTRTRMRTRSGGTNQTRTIIMTRRKRKRNYDSLPDDIIIYIFKYINFKNLFNIRNVDTKNKKIIDKNFELLTNDKNKYFYQNYVQKNIERMIIDNKLIEFNLYYKYRYKHISYTSSKVDIDKIIIISSHKRDKASFEIIKYFIVYNDVLNAGNALGVISVIKNKISNSNINININKQEYFCKVHNEIYTKLMERSIR